MGLINFGRIQQRVNTELEERRRRQEEERRLQKEIEEADKKAMHEARLGASKTIAEAKIRREIELVKRGMGARKKSAFEQLTGQPFFTGAAGAGNKPKGKAKKKKGINQEVNDLMGW